MTEWIWQIWNESEWANVMKYTYTYDENNNLIEWIFQRWEDLEWATYMRYTYTYDENNNLIEELYQDWEDLEWVTYRRYTNYNYEVCGELSITDNHFPATYDLLSPYPNPFNPTTTISFSIPEFGLTTITVYDLAGRELETLTNKVLSIGNYSINWNASSYPSGVYLIRMDSGEFTQTQKVVLVK